MSACVRRVSVLVSVIASRSPTDRAFFTMRSTVSAGSSAVAAGSGSGGGGWPASRGGGATSTAGGVKVTTFVVLLAATLTFFRPGSHLNLFGRRLGPEEVLKVLALTVMSMILVLTGTFLVMLTHEGPFLDIAFEVTSAFATVGLSRGATGDLDTLGRLVIILIMFVGRLGPLTLGFFLATRTPPRVKHPPGEVLLG